MSDRQKKYFACDPEDGSHEFFETLEEAKEFILGQDWSDGYPESFSDGDYVIGEITHRSNFKITERREDFCDCDGYGDCNNPDCEPWPYSNEFEYIGEPSLEEI